MDEELEMFAAACMSGDGAVPLRDRIFARARRWAKDNDNFAVDLDAALVRGADSLASEPPFLLLAWGEEEDWSLTLFAIPEAEIAGPRGEALLQVNSGKVAEGPSAIAIAMSRLPPALPPSDSERKLPGLSSLRVMAALGVGPHAKAPTDEVGDTAGACSRTPSCQAAKKPT